MGAGLVAMVAGLTIGKKKYAEVEAEMQAIRVMAESLRKELTQAVDDDAASFEVLMATFKLPKETDEQKLHATPQLSKLHSMPRIFRCMLQKILSKVMELALKCAKDANVNAISDSMSGFAMSRAALTAAGYNVRININSARR